MLRKLFMALPLCLATSSALAEVFADTMKWDEADWSCPSSIVVRDVRYRLLNASIYDGPPEGLANIGPHELGNGLWGNKLSVGENIYLTCSYKNLGEGMIVHAMGATFCAGTVQPPRMACWKKVPGEAQ